jgi:hypothetical protein
MSIVLVIIGLIVGGVLVGRDLIGAAAIRAQVTQIEQYNTAANTFYGRYNYLPGDMPNPPAVGLGFRPRGQYAGQGDGNGVIQGNWGNNTAGTGGVQEDAGETVVFWVDLSMAGLIEGAFSAAYETIVVTVSGSQVGTFFPQAKLGQGNYIYAYSGWWWNGSSWVTDGTNYFGLSVVTTNNVEACCGLITSTPGLTVAQAFAIDTKIDDGLPQSGRVLARYNTNYVGNPSGVTTAWAGTTISGQTSYTTATPGSSTTCFDNGDSTGATQQYSTEESGGNGVNCALSFVMQGAAR